MKKVNSKKGLMRTTVLAAALATAYINVSAAPVAYTPHAINMDPASWSIDRSDASVFERVTFEGRDSLRLGITPPAEGGSFYNWQGYSQRTQAAAGESFLRGDLWINDGWQTGSDIDYQNTGMWGSAMPESVVANGTYVDAEAVFPIIHFSNEQDIAGGNPDGIGMLRVWDTTDGDGWIYLANTAGLINYDSWNSLDMRLIPEENKIEYYFNGTKVYTWEDPTSDNNTKPGQFFAMYLKARNNGETTFDTYWSRLLAGTVYSDGDVSGPITGDVLVDAGASVNVSDGTTISGSLLGNGTTTATTVVNFGGDVDIGADVIGTSTGFSFSTDSGAVATIGRDLVLESQSAASGGSEASRIQVGRNINLNDSLLSGYWSVNGSVLAANGARIEDADIVANNTETVLKVSQSGAAVTVKDSSLASNRAGLGSGDLVTIANVSNGAEVNIEGGSLKASGGNYTRGILAYNGGKVTTDGTNISTAGINSHAVHAFGKTGEAAPVIELDGGNVTATGDKSWGLYAQNGGQIVSSANVTTTGDGGFGVFAGNWNGGETKITLTGGTITTEGSINDLGQGSHGVIANTTGAIVEVNDTTVNVTGNHYEYYDVDPETRLENTQAAALLAEVGGLITTSNATINTTGDWAFGALADGLGAKIIIDPATTITTTKVGSSTVYARAAGEIEVTGATLSTAGQDARGLYARTAGSKVTATDVTVNTTGLYGHAAYARDGAEVVVSGGSLGTSGNAAHGVHSRGAGSNLTANDVAISATGIGGAGAYAREAGVLTLNGGSITTAGGGTDVDGMASGVRSRDAGSQANINGTHITVKGNFTEDGPQGAGLQASDGGIITSTGATTISTTGDWAFGAVAEGLGAKIILKPGATITTQKVGSSAVHARGAGQVEVVDATLSTAGQGARGLYARWDDAKVTASNVTVTTTGLEGMGAYAREGGVVSVANSTINTSGTDAFGLYSRDAGSVLTAKNVAVTTTGVFGLGIEVRDGAQMTTEGVTVKTSGENAHGVRVRNNGSSLTMTGGSITTTDTTNKSAGLVVVNQSSATLNGVTVESAGPSVVSFFDQAGRTQAITIGKDSRLQKNNGTLLRVERLGAGEDGEVTLTLQSGSYASGNIRNYDGEDNLVASDLTHFIVQDGAQWAGIVIDDETIVIDDNTGALDDFTTGEGEDVAIEGSTDAPRQFNGTTSIGGSASIGAGTQVVFNGPTNVGEDLNGQDDSDTTVEGPANIGGSVIGGAGSSFAFNGASTTIGGGVGGAGGSSMTFGGITDISASVNVVTGSSFAFNGPTTTIGGDVGGVGGSSIVFGGAANIGGNVSGAAGSSLAFNGPTSIVGSLSGTGASFISFAPGTPIQIGGDVALGGGSSISGGSAGAPIQIGGDALVNGGSTLGGNLNIAGMVSGAGAILGPGNSIGVHTYGSMGELSGTYVAEVNAAGESDLIKIASGNADLTGIDLQVSQENGTGGYKLNHDYTIVETAKADGISAVSGNQFASQALDDTFEGTLVKLDAAQYGANTVKISLSADEEEIEVIRTGLSRNQNATLDGVLSVAGQNASADAALQSSDYKNALNQLSGEVHASTQTALLNNSHLVTRTLSNRMRSNLGAGLQPGAPTAQASGAVAGSMPTSSAYPLWAQVVGSWTELDGDGNAAKAKSDTAGLFLGGDTQVGAGWRVGAAVGYTDGKIKVSDRSSKSDVTSYTAALYGGNSWATAKGQVNFLAGAAYTNHEVDSRRTVTVGGSQTLKADYDVNTTQLFTELGYAIPVGQASVVEPYLGVAWLSQKAKSFSESGGSAALHGTSQSDDVTTFTLGLRGATAVSTGKSEARLTAGLGWRHASGDVDATRSMSFIQGGGDAFRIAGAPIAENAAVVDLGAEVSVGKNTALGLSYSGQFGDGSSDNAGTVYVRVRF